ncbi:response regulator [Corynebacterium cystitidis]|uniref:response regulator n=1 Tax=Corynebacterium cystitidis TaxID=35757 RepID=UPI00211EE8FD|nr:response regulator transcription factor [Corynebacterium cystitidis]
MPGESGIDLVHEFGQKFPHIPVVGITSFDVDEYVVEILRAGAAGLILKSSTRDEVLQAVQEAAAGRTYIDSDIAGRLKRYLRPVKKDSTCANSVNIVPTKREAQVLNHLLEGLSNQGIAKELNVTEAAVKNMSLIF